MGVKLCIAAIIGGMCQQGGEKSHVGAKMAPHQSTLRSGSEVVPCEIQFNYITVIIASIQAPVWRKQGLMGGEAHFAGSVFARLN